MTLIFTWPVSKSSMTTWTLFPAAWEDETSREEAPFPEPAFILEGWDRSVPFPSAPEKSVPSGGGRKAGGRLSDAMFSPWAGFSSKGSAVELGPLPFEAKTLGPEPWVDPNAVAPLRCSASRNLIHPQPRQTPPRRTAKKAHWAFLNKLHAFSRSWAFQRDPAWASKWAAVSSTQSSGVAPSFPCNASRAWRVNAGSLWKRSSNSFWASPLRVPSRYSWIRVSRDRVTATSPASWVSW